MTKPVSATIASIFAAYLFAPVANAQTAANAWVSGSGKDVSTCGPVTTPCRTFQYTHDHIVIAGGQIRVKDPAGYSPITINKSISIINDGVGLAAISAPSGNAITINASTSDMVYIKGLSLDGGGTGSNGIAVNSANTVTITNTTITSFHSVNGTGLFVISSQSVFLYDNTFASNTTGVVLNNQSSTPLTAFISGNHIFNNPNTGLACFTTNALSIVSWSNNTIYRSMINNCIITNLVTN
jgi:hypothetical protein